jgi:hypothetical protein
VPASESSRVGSNSTRTSSRRTGTVFWTCSVTTYFFSRPFHVRVVRVPTTSSSSDRVIASLEASGSTS